MTMQVQKPNMAEIKNKERRDREKQARADIRRIDDALTSNDEEKMNEVHSDMDCKYQVAIIDWGMSLYGYSPEYGIVSDSLGIDSLIDNLKKMRAKIEAYGEGKNVRSNESSSTGNSINVSAFSMSHSDAEVTIEQSFSDAKDMISNLTTLPIEQVNELHEQLGKLEEIAESNANKSEKWDKAAPIFKYVIEKGIDVAKIVFPLITNM